MPPSFGPVRLKHSTKDVIALSKVTAQKSASIHHCSHRPYTTVAPDSIQSSFPLSLLFPPHSLSLFLRLRPFRFRLIRLLLFCSATHSFLSLSLLPLSLLSKSALTLFPTVIAYSYSYSLESSFIKSLRLQEFLLISSRAQISAHQQC